MGFFNNQGNAKHVMVIYKINDGLYQPSQVQEEERDKDKMVDKKMDGFVQCSPVIMLCFGFAEKHMVVVLILLTMVSKSSEEQINAEMHSIM